MNQKVYIGKNAIAEWLSEMRTIAPKHCFVVRGHRSYEACGGYEVIEKLQTETHCQITEFEDFSVNPKYKEAQVGMEKLLQSNADMIIAIGGGSVLDISKLIRHMAVEKGYSIPLHAMPTTAGTGAEATHFAVVYIEGKKQSIAADDILPDVAVVYPPFTYSNSKYQTACAGFDAVAQAIESFWAKGATDESRQYSVKALSLLWKQLPQLIQFPTEELRDQISEGAYWAGRAINISTTTAPHAFSYAFTSRYGYPHGHAVALTFPFFMQLNGTKDLFELLGFSPIGIIPQMEAYIESLGLNLSLNSSVDVLSTLQQVNLQRLSNNPIEVTKEIMKELKNYLKNEHNLLV